MSPSATLAQDSAEALLTRAKGVLAQLEGELRLPGLKQPVEVLRDEWGIAHIYAKNDHDLFLAQGCVVAQDRLFQIDLWRRIGLGQTAEIFGEEAIEADRLARLLLYRGDMQAEWESYSPDAQAIATAYTSGINAYLDQLGDKLPIEFQILGYAPAKWRPEDILGRMSGIIMTGNWQREVSRARLIASVGLEEARRLTPTDPPRNFAPELDLDLADITTDILAGYRAATRVFKYQPSPSESNNWVIDGTLSASGRPMLASDPHRSITLPSLRYLVHLQAPGWNVIGSGEPALPGVAIGHNEQMAWGFTIVGTDQSDLYIEETRPDDPRQYKVGDRWEPMRVVTEELRVRGHKEPLKLELRFTRHGPVLHQDEKKGRAVALKWVGADPGGAAYLRSLAVARAQNKHQFVESLAAWKMPGLNFVYADRSGDIGWVAAAGTPIRRGWDGLLPVPGAAGKYEWQGYLPLAEYPQTHNPSGHWVATANQNTLAPDYPHQISYEWSAPYRYERIKERLTQKKQFTLEDFQSIQHENTSLPALALIRVLKTVDLPAELADYGKLLCKWDGVLSREAAAGPLYATWLQEMTAVVFEKFPPEARLDRGDLRSVTVLLDQLDKPDAASFGADPRAGRDEFIRKTLTRAVERVTKSLGDDPSQWSWGKLHTASFPHPLASLGPACDKAFSLGPVPRSGDGYTPHNTRHNDAFGQMHGASYRHVLDLADWDRGLATSTPGQSGQPGSPHYADLLPLWTEGKYFPLAFSRAKVEAVTRHRLMLRP